MNITGVMEKAGAVLESTSVGELVLSSQRKAKNSVGSVRGKRV